MSRRLIALLSSVILCAALPVFAQDADQQLTALTIQETPASPGPDSTVTLTAESALIDLQDSDVEWTVNGNAAGTGPSINVTLGGLGQETDVDVSVSGQSGNDSASIAIVPTAIDLLWEANSYVPPFYQGRALPTSGSSIRLLAIPHFIGSDGTVVPSSDIDFTWDLNGAVDQAQSGIGESSAVFPAAVLYDTDVITVNAQTPDSSLTGEANVSIRTGEPELELYEDDPLFGVTYYHALAQNSSATQSETSFAAVPYFADATSANDPSLAYAWNVNGSPVATDPQDPSEVTINAQSAGVAQISLAVSKPSDPFFGASGSWAVSFSTAAAGSAASAPGNLFQSP